MDSVKNKIIFENKILTKKWSNDKSLLYKINEIESMKQNKRDKSFLYNDNPIMAVWRNIRDNVDSWAVKVSQIINMM